MYKALGLIFVFGLIILSCESIESSWNRAMNVNTIEEYDNFINHHRNSEYYEKAIEKILDLCLQNNLPSIADSFFYKEYLVWKRKNSQGNLFLLTNKMVSFYKRSLVDSTETNKKFLWLLNEDQFWAYKQAIEEFPESNFTKFAQIRIHIFRHDTLREDKFFTFDEMENTYYWDHSFDGYPWKNVERKIEIKLGRRITSYSGGLTIGNLQVEGEVTPKENGFAFLRNTIITYPSAGGKNTK